MGQEREVSHGVVYFHDEGLQFSSCVQACCVHGLLLDVDRLDISQSTEVRAFALQLATQFSTSSSSPTAEATNAPWLHLLVNNAGIANPYMGIQYGGEGGEGGADAWAACVARWDAYVGVNLTGEVLPDCVGVGGGGGMLQALGRSAQMLYACKPLYSTGTDEAR